MLYLIDICVEYIFIFWILEVWVLLEIGKSVISGVFFILNFYVDVMEKWVFVNFKKFIFVFVYKILVIFWKYFMRFYLIVFMIVIKYFLDIWFILYKWVIFLC